MKPEDFWKNITDDQFNAVVDKFGFSEEDLDDISTARIIVCELAHGPSPYEHSYVDVTCGGEDCVDPKHLRWARLPSLERLMESIHNATDLDELLRAFRELQRALEGALQKYGAVAPKPGERHTPPPTFGGRRPADAVGVMSWDEHRLLVDSSTGCQIVNRAEWRGLPPEERAMLEGWSWGRSDH
jgi:hypothetical protein